MHRKTAYSIKCPRCGDWTKEHERVLRADPDGVAVQTLVLPAVRNNDTGSWRSGQR